MEEQRMEESAREGLLVDGSGAPLAEEDSGSVELSDGTLVAYHAIAPENASALQRFHHRLSERSIYLRFFAAKPDLSDREAAYFTNVDRIDRFALVALDPERAEEIIAVVSFDREGNTERAEYAAEVEDRRASLFPTRILLATDGSEDARRAVKTAIALSTKLNSELHFRRGHNSL